MPPTTLWRTHPALGFALALVAGSAGAYALLLHGYGLRPAPLFLAFAALTLGMLLLTFTPKAKLPSWGFALGVWLWWALLGLLSSAFWQKSDRVQVPSTRQTLTGIVTDVPHRTDSAALLTLTLVADSALPIGMGQRVSVWLYAPRTAQPTLGDALVATTRWRENHLYRPGTTQHSFVAWQRRQGIVATGYLRPETWYKLPDSLAVRLRTHLPPTHRLHLTAMQWRAAISARYATLLSDTAVLAIAQSLTLGDRSALTPQLRKLYSTSGASHVLALSGLHLGILYTLLMGLLSLLPLGRSGRGFTLLTTLALLWLYAWLVGLPISVVRSVVMFSLLTLARWRMEDGFSLNNLGWAAIVVLLVWPSAVADIGFQLSFMAVLGILVGLPLCRQWRPHWRIGRWVYDVLAVSCCAQLAVAPLLAYHFQALPTYFLITNLVVSLLVPLILMLGLATLLLPLGVLAQSAAFALTTCIRALNASLATIASWPHSTLTLTPTLWQVIVAYALLTLTFTAAHQATRHKPIT